MRLAAFLAASLVIAGCDSEWQSLDADGDGQTVLDGDCWDNPEGPDGTTLTGADIYLGAQETWYDGIDQDCAGDDDFDADGDGYVPSEYEGSTTALVDGTGELPAGDCWDDPLAESTDHEVSTGQDAEGTALSWVALSAFDVHPAATDTWYDGADQDCAGDDDFDMDLDGYQTDFYPNTDGSFGDDCDDDAEAINPAAAEVWYDGVDDNCDENDCDADGDGYDVDGQDLGVCETEECNDGDAGIYPDPSIPEVWYNGVDENCDGNDGDQDGDGYWYAEYDVLVEAAGGEPLEIPTGYEGDCWDDPADTPADYTVVSGSDAQGNTLSWTQPTSEEVYPDAEDTWYDGVDSDCSDGSDFDADSDGFDTDVYPDATGSFGTDCNDGEEDINPSTIESWYDGVDDDCDGNDGDRDGDGYYIDSYEHTVPDGYLQSDCDDTDDDIYPDQVETWYDGVDDDCDGNDGDADGDGYYISTYFYTVPDEFQDSDCDDENAEIYPDQTETWYGGVDDNCDGNDGDADEDGYYIVDYGFTVPFGYDQNDCDDTDDAIYPDQTETWYDGVDDDCDENDGDADGDGYYVTGYAYTVPAAFESDDCDDDDAQIYPTQTETWYDGVDDDCDTNDGDADGDGYYISSYAYAVPATFDSDDCDDGNDQIYPDQIETWYDGVDDNCDTNDGDQDGDGYYIVDYTHAVPATFDINDCDDDNDAIYPTQTETWYDGVDDNCDTNDGDADGDGYYVADYSYGVPAGFASQDCDDTNGAIYPSQDETWYDGVDDNCDENDGDIDGDGYYVAGYAYTVPTGYDEDDCDDGDDQIYPDQLESWYDGTDDNCDGNDGDQDGDGYFISGYAYTVPPVYDSNDCNDNESAVHPGQVESWYDGTDDDCDTNDGDQDGDGFYIDTYAFTVPGTYGTGDCNDGDDAINPDADEVCDEIDNNCTDGIDEDSALDALTWYADTDEDTYGDENNTTQACLQPTGYVSDDQDCDDDDDDQNPVATEYCNEEDDNCDGDIDEDSAADASTWYADSDGDDYGDATDFTNACTQPNFYVADDQDCDDADENQNPAATEYCNEEDDNCDGDIDEDSAADATTWYADTDEDGYGDATDSDISCEQPTGYVSTDTDCDDTDDAVNPAVLEVCDTIDNDCDDEIDEADAIDATTWYADTDEDGYGDSADSVDSCEEPIGYTDNDDDCDDSDDAIIDATTWYADTDLDSYGDPTTATESCLPPEDYVTDDTDCDDTDEDLNQDDNDSDGYTTCDDDCDDTDETINPGAVDIGFDDIDQDCSGDDSEAYLTAENLVAGDLVITEIMQNPSNLLDANGEWFEVYNTTEWVILADGLGVRDDGSDDFNVTAKSMTEISPGEHFVFAVGSATDAGTSVYEWSGFNLVNTYDEIELYYDAGGTETIIDRVAWDDGATFPDPDGSSMSLCPKLDEPISAIDATENDDGTYWTESVTTMSSGDLGTPGDGNDDHYCF